MSAGKVFTELAVLVCALTFVGQSSSNLVISQSYGGLYELSSLTEPATQDAEATLLETGKLMTRPIAGGQVHSYKFDASAGDFLSVVVEQHAVDVVVRLLAPNGKSIAQVDSPNGAYGPEPLLAIIDATGSYRLEVKTFPGGTTSGSYEIGLRELRKATQADKDRVPIVWAAQHALDRGVQLANQGPKSAAEALVAYEEALGLWRQLNEPYWQGLSLANMAQIYGFLGALEKALEYYNQALSLQKAATDNRGAAATLDALGEIYFQQGEKPKALDYFNQALTLRRVAGDIRGEGLTLVGLGRVYSSIGETKKALDFFNQALALLKTTDDRGAEAVALGNIGKIYFHVGDLQKALELYNRALEIFVAVRNRSAEAKILIDIGSVYNDLGDKEKALDLFSKGLTSFRALGDGN
ncbi:MAG TPA: tetratricopeptide repeat protein, partial [Pyrinomonadaceae bacterium]|nr:tetratricopeptide repeat protein [Pyrinomonadaceae bacterium]